ncbi:MAG: hypothetical protein MI673_08455 [Thiotrichales bacterium]|nr:hypothetical protein [Thiotrichales bacterium]
MLALICAHPAEARPLIENLDLQPDPAGRLFRVYSNPEAALALVVSGQGKIAAAMACMHLYDCLQLGPCDAWLNVGIAGHARRTIGEAVLAYRIRDAATDEAWYPQINFPVDMPTDSCLTVDRPLAEYPDHLCDMEASGLYSAATRFTSLELLHSLKVVSDNRDQPYPQVKPALATDLITAVMPRIRHLIAVLGTASKDLHGTYAADAIHAVFLRRWHFTHTQGHQLRQWLRNWHCLYPEQDPLSHFHSCSSAQKVLAALQAELAAAEISLP